WPEVLNGSSPRGTASSTAQIPMADAETVIVHDRFQVPAAEAIADRMMGPAKFARLNSWVISPMTAETEPPGGAMSTACRVTVVGTAAPAKENSAAANSGHVTVPGTADQSGANTKNEVT